MENIVNTELQSRGGVKPSSNATFHCYIRRFFESLKKKCCKLSLVNSESTNNKQSNDNKVDSPLSWIIASLGQVAHFTSDVIRNVLATSGWVRSAHTAPYAKSAHKRQLTKFAFTLAETLVVMGIIGVVAALTIPNLNQSTGDREKVAKLKKVYSNLEDAFGRVTAVYGPIEEWINNLSTAVDAQTRIGDRLTEFMKVSKNCGSQKTEGTITGCFSNAVKNYLGTGTPDTLDEQGYRFILADGTAVSILDRPPLGVIIVDIDGPNKGPNQLGRDIFLIKWSNRPYSLGVYRGTMAQYLTDLTPKSGADGYMATGWILDYGNMDYLKLTSEGKCPNGTIPTENSPTCK